MKCLPAVALVCLACLVCLGSTGCARGLSRDQALDKLIAKVRDGDGDYAWVRYCVLVHDNPAVGQYWQTTTTASDESKYKSVTTLLIVKVEKERVIVEEDGGLGIVFAYEVDTGKDRTAALLWGNVVQAWVGKPGERPQKVMRIMDAPYPLKGGTKPARGEYAPNAKFEYHSADFTETIAGRNWTGKKTTYAIGTTSWYASDGWFDGEVRHSFGSSGTLRSELSAFGDDGKPLLRWTDAD